MEQMAWWRCLFKKSFRKGKHLANQVFKWCRLLKLHGISMRKRSKYRPKGVRLDNLAYVAAGLKTVGSLPEAGVTLKVKNHSALESMLKGQGNRDQLDVLLAAFNVAEALYRINPHLGEPHRLDIKAAQDALFTMGRRFLKTGSMAFTGPEMQAVRYAMEIHDAQLDFCTVREMEKAIDLVNSEILSKHARVILEAA